MSHNTYAAGSAPALSPSVLSDPEMLDIADYLREEAEPPPPNMHRRGLIAMTVGAVGVVYGDIGTSPLYAFREALKPVAGDGITRAEVLGLLSLLIWTLILIVTVKYVLVLLRADNRGEGGVLSLYTLIRLAIGRRSVPVLALAIAGAALFAGDAMITPAISVLSAVEGVELVLPAATDWVLPVTVVILAVLFAVQSRGTGPIAAFFGPVTALWFVTLAVLGLVQIVQRPDVLAAFAPHWAVVFLVSHPGVALVVAGAIFLAVTGAEALYADLGHFGRRPIILAWFALIFPALVLNYLGQGALVLSDPAAAADPFFHLATPSFLPVLVLLATAATVIASQAVISGAFSMARSAVQLGLLPRMTIRHTAHDQSGQIYIGAVNWGLLAGVLLLVLSFETSSALASAYGIAVTGTMVITSVLGILWLSRVRGWSPALAIAAATPVLAIEIGFLSANLIKLADGGYVPALIALAIGTIMWAWWRGTQAILAQGLKSSVPVDSFVRSMAKSSVAITPGTAFFLTPVPETVPAALLHNLRHNRVLHDQTVFLTVETLRVPYATPDERAQFATIGPHFARLTLRFGFMETPNISRAMASARRAGLRFDVMASSFFLGRRRAVVTGPAGPARILDRLYAALARFSADPSAFFHLPRNLVVEMGERVAL